MKVFGSLFPYLYVLYVLFLRARKETTKLTMGNNALHNYFGGKDGVQYEMMPYERTSLAYSMHFMGTNTPIDILTASGGNKNGGLETTTE